MSAGAHVLVTGSTGNLGEKAVAALRSEGDVQITRIGRNTQNRPDVMPADLGNYDAGWSQHFAGVDTVLHLAADPKPIATWESVQALNVDLCLNVLRAAEEGGAQRFVFASSNWILGGYRFSGTRLSSTTPPRPINPYGASKLLMERVGLAQSQRTGMAFLSLRIGYCAPGENRPGPHMAFGRWGQEMWLSNEDWSDAVRRACCEPFEGAAVINIMSANEGMRWDLEGAFAAIGYKPRSHHAPRLTTLGRLHDGIARAREALFPQMSETPRFGSRW
ncbi:MAG: NAD(P)-dependent oxidoreductase [Hyphomicrobiales bacterium]|nr:NAD(P)-dependent oxidoreductase [Hyphomicrobiales bacterium]